MNRLVESHKFRNYYNEADEETKTKIWFLVTSNDPDGLRSYIKHHPLKATEDLGYLQLRLLARRYNIPRYSRLTRLELIKAINGAKQRHADRENQAPPSGSEQTHLEADSPPGLGGLATHAACEGSIQVARESRRTEDDAQVQEERP